MCTTETRNLNLLPRYLELRAIEDPADLEAVVAHLSSPIEFARTAQGWNTVTAVKPMAVNNCGNQPHPPRVDPYSRAVELETVVGRRGGQEDLEPPARHKWRARSVSADREELQ